MVDADRDKEHPQTLDPSALPADVVRVLRDAFGDAPVTDITAMTGGASGALLLSLTAEGRSYVLRRGDPARLAHAHRLTRETVCLRIASASGVAPKLRHLDEAAGITIIEKIVTTPLPRDANAITRVVSTLRRLHDGPTFPDAMSPALAVHRFDEVVRAKDPAGLPADLVATADDIARVTRRFASAVPCHNDLNPGNILTTDDAVYFVDWETAGMADPFLDLGELGVFMFPTPEARAGLVATYLGRSPNEEDAARATIGRVQALAFYAAAFVVHGTFAKGLGSHLAAAPISIMDLLAMLRVGRFELDVLASSLLAEMRRESATDAYKAAKQTLDPG